MNHNPAATRTEVLPVHSCWSQLRSVSVGRLAVWDVDHPDIFPINYTVDHGSLVFRTGQGTKLKALQRDEPVALEVDGVNPDTGFAWSVVAKGNGKLLTSTDDILDSFALRLFPWHAATRTILSASCQLLSPGADSVLHSQPNGGRRRQTCRRLRPNERNTCLFRAPNLWKHQDGPATCSCGTHSRGH
ncbi:pyridoxamine 5'-phosphate oxidase family protein [Arthrobacter alpinus]|uniref:pyridoxamine 5'-phosphate oxidase family protein n=1 Tax=Arthrobacter alpinus TaxID=656366 RepID=UPI003C7134FF